MEQGKSRTWTWNKLVSGAEESAAFRRLTASHKPQQKKR